MKKFIVVVFLFSLTLSLFSYNISDKAKVSLITADPGDELYSVFGHSAIRIKDKAFNVDLVFNYGTFDFSTPNFYMKFAKGKLDYKIDVSSYKEFIPVYM